MTPSQQEAATTDLLSVASPQTRRIALAFGALITVIALATIPLGRTPGPVIAPFLPSYISTVSVLDLMTAILFFLQFRQHGRASTLALACAYLYTSVVVIPHILTFPGVFAPAGLLGAGPQTAVWMWVCWHGGFPMLLLMHAAALRREQQGRGAPLPAGPWVTRAVFATLTLVLLVSLLTIAGQSWLPVIISRDNYFTLITSGVGPVVFLLNLCALIALWHLTRGRTVTELWLLNAVLASLLDVTVTLSAGARYSLGWYMARANSLLCASAVLGAFLFEFHRLQMLLSAANRRLAALADTDALTTLGNRRAFDRKLAEEWSRAARKGESLGLLMLDVDHFKAYNDTYGHQAGDACLQSVAGAIRETLHRPSDFAARYGGEEMAVILPNTDLAGAVYVAETVRQAIEAMGVAHGKSPLGVVTASIGAAATLPGTEQALAGLVAQADAALYHAKNAGRNRVQG